MGEKYRIPHGLPDRIHSLSTSPQLVWRLQRSCAPHPYHKRLRIHFLFYLSDYRCTESPMGYHCRWKKHKFFYAEKSRASETSLRLPRIRKRVFFSVCNRNPWGIRFLLHFMYILLKTVHIFTNYYTPQEAN